MPALHWELIVPEGRVGGTKLISGQAEQLP